MISVTIVLFLQAFSLFRLLQIPYYYWYGMLSVIKKYIKLTSLCYLSLKITSRFGSTAEIMHHAQSSGQIIHEMIIVVN